MRRGSFGWLLLWLCASCYRAHWPPLGGGGGAPGASTGASPAAAAGHSAPPDTPSPASAGAAAPPPPPACTRFVQVSTTVSKADLLFVVDNSSSMKEEQASLREAFPALIHALVSGDRDSDGVPDFPPVKDLHLGVVSTDMGLPGVQGISNCNGLGEDGVLLNRPGASTIGCQASYPPFLSFQSGASDPEQIGTDFACIATLGTAGCGFEQPLEAALKALWPSSDPRMTFLPEPITGLGRLGHGDKENAGFLRDDPSDPSLLAIVVLTDEDDCSVADTHPFTPPQYLDPVDPLVQESMNLRCHYHPQALYPVERYVNGLQDLRPGDEDLVVFAAITGVPPDQVSQDALASVDFSDSTQRERFYQRLLADPRMQEVVDDKGTDDPADDALNHSCISAGGTADPPIRIVQVAQGFGANGLVQSICQEDFRPALDAIVAKLGERLVKRCGE